MDKKVVLITGAAKGIGAAIARKFASSNFDIVIHYLTSEKKAFALKEELENAYSIHVLCQKADISKEEEVKKMVFSVLETFQHIDILINNAAFCQDNFFNEKSGEEFNRVINTNLGGTFLTCKHIGGQMLKQQSGAIVNLSSTNGIDTMETYSMDYDASKAGVISLTKNFAKALAPYVRVNAVAPGWTRTEAVMEMNPIYLKEEENKVLLERFARPEEIANVVFFLAHDASYINSSVVRVDGGLK